MFAAKGGNAEVLKTLAASASYSTLLEISLQDLWNCAVFRGNTETKPPIVINGAD